MYIIYGKENCKYCTAAKELLDSKKSDYSYKQLGQDFDREWLLGYCSKHFNFEPKTMPQIFKEMTNKDGEVVAVSYVGDYDQLNKEIKGE